MIKGRKSILFFIFFITLSLLLSGCNSSGGNEDKTTKTNDSPKTTTVTDMAGREVTIPANIEKAYSVNSIGSIFLYTIKPDSLAGWNSELGTEKQYIKEEYQNLPVLGTYKGPNSINIEELLKTNPDIIINMGDVNPKYIEESDELQELTGIPVIMVDGSLDKQDETYKLLGELLGEKERGERLADYSNKVLDDIKEKAKKISEEEKIRVYYAAGAKGLETSPLGSINTEVLDSVGGLNAAYTGIDKNLRRIDVSLEQVIDWNPEVIIISTDSSENHSVYNTMLNEGSWSHIDAVKNNQVYEIPYAPYDWFNRPPSVMRLMGMKWLGNLLYPENYPINIKEDAKEFFHLFFDYELTDSQVNEMLERSVAQDE